jgi:hypothetical protein
MNHETEKKDASESSQKQRRAVKLNAETLRALEVESPVGPRAFTYPFPDCTTDCTG